MIRQLTVIGVGLIGGSLARALRAAGIRVLVLSGDHPRVVAQVAARLGFAPDCGITYFLPRITRLSTALMMVETGKILNAVFRCSHR